MNSSPIGRISSAVYRYLLTTGEERTVSVDDELAFVGKYAYLEQVRFGESLKIEVADRRSGNSGRVVPTSIQLLVENAIKHNVCLPEKPLNISIDIDDERIEVSNNLQPRANVATSGVGLANLRRQYALHELSLTVERTETVFRASLPIIR